MWKARLRNELMRFATDPLSAGREAAVHALLQVLWTAGANPWDDRTEASR